MIRVEPPQDCSKTSNHDEREGPDVVWIKR